MASVWTPVPPIRAEYKGARIFVDIGVEVQDCNFPKPRGCSQRLLLWLKGEPLVKKLPPMEPWPNKFPGSTWDISRGPHTTRPPSFRGPRFLGSGPIRRDSLGAPPFSLLLLCHLLFPQVAAVPRTKLQFQPFSGLHTISQSQSFTPSGGFHKIRVCKNQITSEFHPIRRFSQD